MAQITEGEQIPEMTLSTENPVPYKILSLDGGGAKGFYSLGVLHEMEAMM